MEGVDPRRNHCCHKLAYKNNCREYAILNVGNLKPSTFNLYLDAKDAFEGPSFSLDESILKYAGFYAREVNLFTQALKDYFDVFTDGTYSCFKPWCDSNSFPYHHYENLPFAEFPLSDFYLRWYLTRPFFYKVKYYDPVLTESFHRSSLAIHKALPEFEKIHVRKGYKKPF